MLRQKKQHIKWFIFASPSNCNDGVLEKKAFNPEESDSDQTNVLKAMSKSIAETRKATKAKLDSAKQISKTFLSSIKDGEEQPNNVASARFLTTKFTDNIGTKPFNGTPDGSCIVIDTAGDTSIVKAVTEQKALMGRRCIIVYGSIHGFNLKSGYEKV